jgi:hypothetical protein
MIRGGYGGGGGRAAQKMTKEAKMAERIMDDMFVSWLFGWKFRDT